MSTVKQVMDVSMPANQETRLRREAAKKVYASIQIDARNAMTSAKNRWDHLLTLRDDAIARGCGDLAAAHQSHIQEEIGRHDAAANIVQYCERKMGGGKG
jgi:hypothetical protein